MSEDSILCAGTYQYYLKKNFFSKGYHEKHDHTWIFDVTLEENEVVLLHEQLFIHLNVTLHICRTPI